MLIPNKTIYPFTEVLEVTDHLEAPRQRENEILILISYSKF